MSPKLFGDNKHFKYEMFYHALPFHQIHATEYEVRLRDLELGITLIGAANFFPEDTSYYFKVINIFARITNWYTYWVP